MSHQEPEKTSELSEKLKFLALAFDEQETIDLSQSWGSFLIAAALEFDDKFYAEKSSYSELDENDWHDPKKFLLSKILQDIIEGGLCLNRWTNSLKHLKDNTPLELKTFFLQSIYKDASRLARRLFEIGIQCTLFEKTNSRPYFEHFLLLHDSKQLLDSVLEHSEFYGFENTITQTKLLTINARLVKLQQERPEVTRSWYVHENFIKSGLKNLNSYFCSTKAQFKLACKMLTNDAKIVFGMTYSQLFGELSMEIHFSPTQINRQPVNIRALITLLNHCYALAVYSLSSLNKLNGTQFAMSTALFKNFEASGAGNVDRFIFTQLQVGDIVIVGNDLAEIISIKISEYGYSAYEVKFIENDGLGLQNYYLGAQLFLYFSVEQQQTWIRENPDFIKLLTKDIPIVSDFVASMDDSTYESAVVQNIALRRLLGIEIAKASATLQRREKKLV